MSFLLQEIRKPRSQTDNWPGTHCHVSSRCYQGKPSSTSLQWLALIVLPDSHADPQPYSVCRIQWNSTRRIPNCNRRGNLELMERHVKCDCWGRYVLHAGLWHEMLILSQVRRMRFILRLTKVCTSPTKERHLLIV